MKTGKLITIIIVVAALSSTATYLIMKQSMTSTAVIEKKDIIDKFKNKFELNTFSPPSEYGYWILVNGNANGMATSLYINDDGIAIAINAQGGKHHFDGQGWVPE